MGGVRKILRLLYDPDPGIRWEGVRGLGDWAEENWSAKPGAVREVLRRLAWSLNDESGATGWGAPEGMGEMMARVPELRVGFEGRFAGLLSNEDVYLGNDVLDAGAIWALGRLGLADRAAELLRPFLGRDAHVRGAIAWTTGRLRLVELRPELEALLEDEEPSVLLEDGAVTARRVADRAGTALAEI